MRELWWMARASWKKTALLAAMSAMPVEGEEPQTPEDFNPFLVGREKDRMANVASYNPSRLQEYQRDLVGE